MRSGVVTVSATYGAAGSVIAPKLAAALGFRFLDRTVSSATAVTAGATSATPSASTPEPPPEPSESPTEAERVATPPSRWVTALAQLASSVPGVPTADLGATGSIGYLRAGADDEVVAAATEGGVVILGRAGAVVLGGHPNAVHIRLDGPIEARIARAQAIEGVDAAEARRRCEATDRMRALYVRRLYGRDSNDPRLYHLLIDTTVLAVDDVVALVQQAATAIWRRAAAR